MRALRTLAFASCAAIAVVLPHAADAAMNAKTANPGAYFETTSLYPPTTFTATASGRNVALSWAAGQNGNGYNIVGAAVASSAACTSATLSAVGTSATLSYTDSRYTPQGSWYCYETQTAYSSWTSASNPRAAVQLGAFASSIVAANGGTAGQLDAGDTLTITFNQAIDPTTSATAANTACITATTPATFVLGSTTTTGTTCVATEGTVLGKITGGTSNKNIRWASTYTWSNGNRTVTVTLGARIFGSNNPVISGSFILTPTTDATKLLTATGAAHVCDTNAGGGTCLPAVTGVI